MIEMKNITKKFLGVNALSDVDFSVGNQEIHALIGANGAGKSTLMKVLAGAYSEYNGNIFIEGCQATITNPMDAKDNGIVIVYQEVDTALIPHLTVAENIMVDQIVGNKNKMVINWKSIREQAARHLESLDLKINCDALVSDLTLSQKQMVLIGRAVFQQAKLLILDEPTAPLSQEEAEKLFTIVNNLKKNGMSVIFISHRLEEIFKICEKITVLKDGQLVGSYNVSDLEVDDVIEKMLGTKLQNTFPKHIDEIGNSVLKVNNLSGTGGIENISLEVHSGEIVGLAGLVGAGKTELCKLLFGEGTINSGCISYLDNIVQINHPYDAVKNGFAMIPEERRKEGILVEESIETNITLPTLDSFCVSSFMKKKLIRKASQAAISKTGIKTVDEKQKVANLSGGNQQKVVIGKWLISDANIYIMDEPTKGVDVGSKAEIYMLISELIKAGKSVIYATCEFNEILGLTDRVYVMYDGKIVKELVTNETNEEELLYYSVGGKTRDENN